MTQPGLLFSQLSTIENKKLAINSLNVYLYSNTELIRMQYLWYSVELIVRKISLDGRHSKWDFPPNMIKRLSVPNQDISKTTNIQTFLSRAGRWMGTNKKTVLDSLEHIYPPNPRLLIPSAHQSISHIKDIYLCPAFRKQLVRILGIV